MANKKLKEVVEKQLAAHLPSDVTAEVVDSDGIKEEVKGTVETVEERKKEQIDNKNKLFLRQFFINYDVSDRVVTKLKGKVFFAKNPNIQPGWYIASITEENDRHGVMDTMALTDVPLILWDPKLIQGIYVKKNYKTNKVEIHKTIPKEKLDFEDSPPIFSFDLPPAPLHNGNSIQDIMKMKLAEKNGKA